MFQINKAQRPSSRRVATFIAMAAICASMTGCNEKEEALQANPVTEEVGTFEGCSVKFVNRGYTNLSFYLAKCPGEATALTNNRVEQHGKTQVQVRSATITETQEIDTKLNDARTEVQRLERKKSALAKLSREEQELLGIHSQEAAPRSPD